MLIMPKATENKPKRPHRVLLVEDSDDDARLFERGLARLAGFEMIGRLRNGQTAIDYLKGEGEFADRNRFRFPDILMLDVKLPGCDGFEVLRWAQRRPSRPVIAVFSVIDGEPERKRLEQLGADLYQTKVWDAPAFDRFLHFVGNIANVKRF